MSISDVGAKGDPCTSIIFIYCAFPTFSIPPVVSYLLRSNILHNTILSWSLGPMDVLPKRRCPNLDESSHSLRTCDAFSAWTLLHTPVDVRPQCALSRPSFGLPPGTARQVGFP